MQGRHRIRALGVGDLLDETFRLYRSNFLLYVLIGAVAYVPVALLQTVLLLAVGSPSAAAGSTAGALGFGAAAVVGMLFFAFGALVVYAAQTITTSDLLHGRTLTLGEAYRRSLRWVLPMIGLGIVVGLAVGLLTITIIGIPFAVYFGVCWVLAYQPLVLERTGVFASLGRSRGLVRGRWWRTLGSLLLIGLMTTVLGFVLGMLIGVLGEVAGALGQDDFSMMVQQIAFFLAQAASGILVNPLVMIAYTLLYYDLRVRKEGYDLELMAEEGFAPAGPTAQPSF